MHASVLNVLCNGIIEELAALANGIQLHLFGTSDVLGNDHWVVRTHLVAGRTKRSQAEPRNEYSSKGQPVDREVQKV